MSNENLIATGSSTRSVVKTRMFASYMSSARNCVAKSRDRFGSKSLYGNIITALFVARKFRRAVSGTYSCASNGTSPRISSRTVEPRATPPPRRESRSRLPVDMWVSVLSTGRNIAVSAGSLKSNGSRYWNRPPARVNRYWSCRIGTPRSFRISSSRARLLQDRHQGLLHLHPSLARNIIGNALPGVEDDEGVLHAREQVVEARDDLVPD